MTKCAICRIMGRNIHLQRVAYGYTQDHVAAEAGITQSALSKVESGHGELRVEAALRIARFLQCTVEELASPHMMLRTAQDRMRKAG